MRFRSGIGQSRRPPPGFSPPLERNGKDRGPSLAKRAADSLGDRAGEVSATRGHLVRQAVQDGLLRDLDELVSEDGTVDLVCDPGMEIPLELENKTLTLTELLDALQYGAPPHGGIALGIDRLVMLFGGLDNIRDCIAFPKTQRASDQMTGAPGEVDLKQLKELGIQSTVPPK